MLQVVCVLLLVAASVEDCRKHQVNRWWTRGVFLLGILHIITEKENRWVTVTLTCICIFFLYLFYRLILFLEVRKNLSWKFGAADVRLIFGMMLVQGWDVALTGVLLGLLAAAVYYLVCAKEKKDIPLIPWMTAGWVVMWFPLCWFA